MKISVKILTILLVGALTFPMLASCSDQDPEGSLSKITIDSTNTGEDSTDGVTVESPSTSDKPETTKITTVETPETTEKPITDPTAEPTTVPTGPTTPATSGTTDPNTGSEPTTDPTTAVQPETTKPQTTTEPETSKPETTTTEKPQTTKPVTTVTEPTTSATTTETPTTSDNTPDPTVPETKERSEVYMEALDGLMGKINSNYYNKSTHFLRSEPGSGNRAFLWGFGAYLESLAEWYSLSPDNADARAYYVDALDNGLAKYRVLANRLTTPAGTFRNIVYYNASAGNSGDYYYDDNAWICYQLLNAYVLLGEVKYLTAAEQLLEFFKTGWDDVLGGGIYWDKTFGGKNTCENGPIAICFLWAYQLTEKEDYLEWGTKVFEWLDKTLREGNLYSDSISKNGKVNNWKADYNQGTPIYAACLLYEITGDEAYLNRARNTASAALSHAFSVSGWGSNQRITINNNPIYKAWCVGWLMRGFEKYVEVSGNTGNYYSYMEAVLDQTLANPRSDGYYDPYFRSSGWESESRTEIVQQSGVACVIAICARYELKIAGS